MKTKINLLGVLFALLFLTIITPAYAQAAVGPQAATVNPGQKVTISVTADGTTPFTYQWYKRGALPTDVDAPIAGATSAQLVLTAQLTDLGIYTCKVSNTAGSTTSPTATLTINRPPTVTGFTLTVQ